MIQLALSIVTIIEVTLFILIMKKLILNKSSIAYIITLVLSTIITVAVLLAWEKTPMVLQLFIAPLYMGSFATYLFIIVMYLGVLKPNKKDGKYNKSLLYLRKVRGEIAIIASIITLSHNIVYGRTYFLALFEIIDKELNIQQVIGAIISIILIILILILGITSFKKIRRKMDPMKWKKLQKLSYIFYGLLYAHIMLVSTVVYHKEGKTHGPNYFSLVFYSIIFITYFILKMKKISKKK